MSTILDPAAERATWTVHNQYWIQYVYLRVPGVPDEILSECTWQNLRHIETSPPSTSAAAMGNVIDGAFGACGACGTEDGSTDAATGNIDLRDGNADGIISAMKARCSSVDTERSIAKHPHGA